MRPVSYPLIRPDPLTREMGIDGRDLLYYLVSAVLLKPYRP